MTSPAFPVAAPEQERSAVSETGRMRWRLSYSDRRV